MDNIRQEAKSSRRETQQSDQPWSSGEFKRTGQLNRSDWQNLRRKLDALLDANTSSTGKTKKLREYRRDLENYKQYAYNPSEGQLSPLVRNIPQNIDDKISINNSLDALKEQEAHL